MTDRPQPRYPQPRFTDVTDLLDLTDRDSFVHQLRLESELYAIESQTHRSRQAQAEADIARLNREVERLKAGGSDDPDTVRISHAEYTRLTEAEHHLRRLLSRVNQGPVGMLARRKAGFRHMVEQWPAQ